MSVFGDFKIDGNQLVAKQTGAAIPLTPGFVRDAWRIASFVWIINGVRASRMVKRREPRTRIFFHPQKPRSYYAIWPVCQLADVRIVDNPGDADLDFYFEDKEFSLSPVTAASGNHIFNMGCLDIRKSVVTRIFEETFGYGFSIDPLSHHGPAVEKSEANGKHDGQIIQCPIAKPRFGKVYQKIIENTFDGRDYIDIRTPIVGGVIPLVFIKRRTGENRFSNENHSVQITETDAMLSQQEQKQIGAFAAAIGLEFGGLDVLRDRNDGRIYIVDVNKTDMGPPSAMRGPDKLKAMRKIADAFAIMVDRALTEKSFAQLNNN